MRTHYLIIEYDLSNAALRDCNLENTDLHKSCLAFADLSNANLRGTNLYESSLCLANLTNANLEGASIGKRDYEAPNLDAQKLTYNRPAILEKSIINIFFFLPLL